MVWTVTKIVMSLMKFHLADKRGSVRMMTGVDGYAGDSVTSMTTIKICFIRRVLFV